MTFPAYFLIFHFLQMRNNPDKVQSELNNEK